MKFTGKCCILATAVATAFPHALHWAIMAQMASCIGLQQAYHKLDQETEQMPHLAVVVSSFSGKLKLY